MTSRLTWIDHDSQARERSLRILALGRVKESRDELGIGGIRDSIADQLFPGTSTIQTRLRYRAAQGDDQSALQNHKIAITGKYPPFESYKEVLRAEIGSEKKTRRSGRKI